jgi:starch synthase
MRIVFATAEVSPIAKTGGLGDVCGSLPKALAALGHEVIVVMPFYRQAREWFERSGQEVELAIPPTSITWAGWSADATYFRSTLPGTSIPLYLIANDFYFERDAIYALRADGYDDGFERFTFFCRALIRACEILDIAPDILHAHDWHAALLPLYLDSGLRGSGPFATTRSVYTIHNLNYQGIAPRDRFGILGLHPRYWAADALEHFGEINLMKGGIIFGDQVTTVSPNYAREIQTAAVGAGLDGVLRSLSFKLSGIVNGIDVDEWDPATDEYLDANYDSEKMHGKTIAKRMLAREAGLKYKVKTPIFAVVSRLVDQKGLQLLAPVLPRLLDAGAEGVILGSGDPAMESAFAALGAAEKGRCSVMIGFDNAYAHRIYAGADILLMPSIYEPCGLNQMYALRYGTVPVVRLTGGLVDTVIPFDGTNRDEANGFGFAGVTPAELYAATWISMLNYRDTRSWKVLQANGMAADFSWDRSAREYESVYRRAASL